MSLPLNSVTAEMLPKCYPPHAASTIAHQVREFLPYESNFPLFTAYIAKDRTGVDVLTIDTQLLVRNAQGGGSGNGDPVRVTLTYPPRFPQEVIQVQLLLPDHSGQRRWKVKEPYPVMGKDGHVQVECLPFLRGVERPFPLLDVLLALSEQFEVEFPYVAAPGQGGTPPQLQQQQQTRASANASGETDIMKAILDSTHDANRRALLQEAAEKVVIDLNGKATAYLETREKSLGFLQQLNESNRELTRAKDILSNHKTELEGYLPSVGDVGVLVKQLETLPNTMEEHDRCLAAQTDTQERALTLMAEIHASEDVLALLEEGLKNDYFTVDEYVKCVSDVGRDQFAARFLCQRVLKDLNKDGGISSRPSDTAPAAPTSPAPLAAPAIPQRLNPEEALRCEFPRADPEIIRDVLRNVNNDPAVARLELRAMYS